MRDDFYIALPIVIWLAYQKYKFQKADIERRYRKNKAAEQFLNGTITLEEFKERWRQE